MTGRILNGRYEVHNEVGSGGMAIIYAAKDLATGWEVAVKVLRQEFSDDIEFVRRFKREAQAVANLDHPCIVRVYDVGQDEGVHFIVMEFVHGISLKEYIRREGPLSVEDSMRISLDISGALKNAHDNGVIHRDVKPHNVLVSPDGRVKITDFGIAKIADMASTNPPGGNVMGSVHYISPEQARGEETDEQADIYSLGVTLYEMLTGRLPYEGESTVEVARKHLNEPLIAPEDVNSKIPHSLSQVVVKAMAKDRKTRYKTCGEFARDLMRSYSDPNGNFVDLPSYQPKPKPAKQPQPPQPVERERYVAPRPEPKKAGNRSRVIIIIGIILILLLAAVLMIVLMNRPKEEEPTIEMVPIPSVIGMSLQEAELAISRSGLTPVVEMQYSDETPKNEVMHQSPAAGTIAEPRSSVRIVVSDGQEPIAVPRLYGMTQEQAEQALMDVGLRLGGVSFDTQELIDAGVVFKQDPEPNTELMPGDEVDIVINEVQETNVNMLMVPYVVDDTVSVAVQKVHDTGFEHCVVNEEAEDAFIVPGTVTDQKPRSDEEVEMETLVRLYATEHREKTYTYNVSITFDAPSGLEYVIALEDSGIYYVIEEGITTDEGTIPKEMYEVYTQTEVSGNILLFVDGQLTNPVSSVVTQR